MDWKTSRNHVVENWSEIRRGYCDGLVVGADVVEVSPPFDHGDITAILASNIVFEYLSLLALKNG